MSLTRMVFTKWGDRPHWQYDAWILGTDLHGTWLGLPVGTHVARPGMEFDTGEDQVVLVPSAGYVATFYAAGGTAPCDLYVDVCTPPRVGASTIRTVDLDLDVIRGRTGRVWVDDEDEFAEHRATFGYPSAVVDLAVATCGQVRRAVEQGDPPFDPGTSSHWFDVLQGLADRQEVP